MRNFYLTTTLPYVNAAPHIGFALEMVQADALARYHRDILGEKVVFNTGTDEHGLKIYRQALAEGKDPQEYADEYAAKFGRLKEALNLSYTNFIRTTDPAHKTAAQEFWRRSKAKGDIEKRKYETRYCVGCELEKTDSELLDGKCPLHPNLELELIAEENWFFKFKNYEEALLDLYESRPDFVLPEHRLKEIKNFVAGGLADFSISRLKSKMPWGIPVPDDDEQVMYVWFDALINYVSTLGWPADEARFAEFWGTAAEPNAIQIAGKDNLRQQAAIWQAMLMSAGLPTSRQILVHGFLTSDGAKISKSMGNVVDPIALAQTYGADALRFWLLKEVPTFGDADFTLERFKEAYNAHLANGLGNLVSRIMTLAAEHLPEPIERPPVAPFPEEYTSALANADLKGAMDFVWAKIQSLDQRIAEIEPYKLIKSDPAKGRALIAELTVELYWIGRWLNPFLPAANVAIKETVLANKKPPVLFPRLS